MPVQGYCSVWLARAESEYSKPSRLCLSVAAIDGAQSSRFRSMKLNADVIQQLGKDPLVGPTVVLRACRASFIEISSEQHWRPVSGSRAAADRIDLDGFDPAVSTPQQPAGAFLIEEVVATFLEIASVHVDAMGELCGSGRLMLPIEALGRATLEATSHAVWVLGAGEEIDARDRLARAYLCEYASAVRDKSVSALRPSGPSESAARRREVLARCRSTFRDSTTREMEAGRLAGQTFPGLNEVVTGYLNRAVSSGAVSLPDHMIAPIYRYLSSGAHPSLFRLREVRELVPHEEHAGTKLRLAIETLRSTALLISGLFAVALRTTADHFGWDEEACSNLYDIIDVAFPEALSK